MAGHLEATLEGKKKKKKLLDFCNNFCLSSLSGVLKAVGHINDTLGPALIASVSHWNDWSLFPCFRAFSWFSYNIYPNELYDGDSSCGCLHLTVYIFKKVEYFHLKSSWNLFSWAALVWIYLTYVSAQCVRYYSVCFCSRVFVCRASAWWNRSSWTTWWSRWMAQKTNVSWDN